MNLTFKVTHSLCLSLVVMLAGCAADSDVATQPIAGSPGASSGARNLANEVTNEVNRYRQQIGAKPLPRDRGLDQLAQSHADYLVKNSGTFSLHGKTVSHYGFEGRSLVARKRLGYDSVSENVASSTGSTRSAAQTFRQLWTNSKGHKRNMSSSWTHTGVGVATTPEGLIVAVQLFGSKGMRSHNEMTDGFRGY